MFKTEENFKTVYQKVDAVAYNRRLLREAPAMIFDWEHFVVSDRLASIAYSLEDGLLQGVTAP